MFLFGFSGRLVMGLGVMLLGMALLAVQSQAFEIKNDNPDLRMMFDNTVTYSTIYRLGDQDEALISPELTHGEAANSDDGNRNFDKGFVMNRFDLLSEFDLVYKRFGFRVTAAAWYDFVYNTSNDNDSPGTVNHYGPHNEFPDATETLHGSDLELLEAFTFGAVDLGDMTFRYRAGQFTQWWGDSFFFGANGVASGLAPVDVAKAATLPNTQLKELIRPIPQVSVGLQVTDTLSFDAYYQFKWEPARFFGSGSYFSPVDIFGVGADYITAGPGPDGNPIVLFTKTDNVEPDDSGQFGIKMKKSTMWADFGLYYLNYHSKDFIGTNVLQVIDTPGGPVPIPYQYYEYYPDDIEAYAASANTSWGFFTFAAEVTYRKNVPLATRKGATGPVKIEAFHVDPHYPRGETLHVNINSFSPGLPPTALYDSMDLIAEVGYANCLSVDEYEDMIDPSMSDDSALVAQIVLEPKWFQVLPGLNLHMPMGINYGFKSNSKVVAGGGYPVHKGGDFNIGIYGLYNNVWECALMYRNYFGNEVYDTFDAGDPVYARYQAHGDRDYVSFYIRRAF
jgi:hypothetical protein